MMQSSSLAAEQIYREAAAAAAAADQEARAPQSMPTFGVGARPPAPAHCDVNKVDVELCTATFEFIKKVVRMSEGGEKLPKAAPAIDLRSLLVNLVDAQLRWAEPHDVTFGADDADDAADDDAGRWLPCPKPIEFLIAQRVMYECPERLTHLEPARFYEHVGAKTFCFVGGETWEALVAEGALTGDDTKPPVDSMFEWVPDLFQFFLAEGRHPEARRLAACWYYQATEIDHFDDEDDDEDSPSEDSNGLRDGTVSGSNTADPGVETPETSTTKYERDEDQDDDDGEMPALAEPADDDEDDLPPPLLLNAEHGENGAPDGEHLLDGDVIDEDDDGMPGLASNMHSTRLDGDDADQSDSEDSDFVPSDSDSDASSDDDDAEGTGEGPADLTDLMSELGQGLRHGQATGLIGVLGQIMAAADAQQAGGGSDGDEGGPVAESAAAAARRQAILAAVDQLHAYLPSPDTHMPFFKRMLRKIQQVQELGDQDQLDRWFPWGAPPLQHMVDVLTRDPVEDDKGDFLREILTVFASLQAEQDQ